MADIVCRVIDCHVFRREGSVVKYLLLRRSAEVMYAGSWRMVGGKIEPPEKAYETALRELKEETGMSAIRLWAVPYINQFYEASKDRINLIPVFAAEVHQEPVVLSHEHNLAKWFTYEDARLSLPWPAQLEGLRIVNEFIAAGKPVAGFVEIEVH